MGKLVLIIVIALASIVPELCFAQYSSKIYDIDSTSDFGVYINLLPTGGCVLTGFGLNLNEEHLSTMVLNSNGNLLLQKKLFITPNLTYQQGRFGRTANSGNGDFVIPLNLTKGSSPANVFSINSSMAKFNGSGDTIWIKSYTDTALSKEVSLSVAKAANGDLILGGNKRNPDYYAISSAQLIRTDSNGEEKWRKTYQKFSGKHCYINNAEELSDGRVFVSATTQDIVYISPSYTYIRTTPWAFITDSSGNLVREHLFDNRYGGNNNYSSFEASSTVFVDKNGGYYMYGRLDSVLKPGNYQAYNNDPSFIAHLDTNFNVIWERNFADTTALTHIMSARQLHDNSYLLIGEYGGTNLYPFRGWACRMDKNGTIIWKNYYTYDTTHEQYLFDAVELTDHNIVFSGGALDHTLPSWRQYDVWVLTVDSNGCAQPGCAPTAVAHLPPKQEPTLSPYPNPTTGRFTLRAPATGDFILYSVQGQKVAAYAVHQGEQQLQLPDACPAGVYYGRFTSAKGMGQSVKIIYQP